MILIPLYVSDKKYFVQIYYSIVHMYLCKSNTVQRRPTLQVIYIHVLYCVCKIGLFKQDWILDNKVKSKTACIYKSMSSLKLIKVQVWNKNILKVIKRCIDICFYKVLIFCIKSKYSQFKRYVKYKIGSCVSHNLLLIKLTRISRNWNEN